jgi:3-hydroxyacyl-CoA dehydrogenase
MLVRKVAIIGVGNMGRSITLAVAIAGYEVSLRSRRGIEGYEELVGFLRREIEKGKINDCNSHLGHSASDN